MKVPKGILIVLGPGLSPAGGCLPDDAREPPAEVLVTVEPSPATRTGFSTSTGWDVIFDRVLLNIGRVGFVDRDDCASYSVTQYDWLMDLTRADVEKVGLVHALGDCRLRFDVPAVIPDAVRIGVGADVTDRELMSFENSVRVIGRAVQDEQEVTFSIALPYFGLGPCFEDFTLSAIASSELVSEQSYTLPLLASPEALFAPLATPGSSGFDFGQADVDGGGFVDTFEWINAFVGDVVFGVEVNGFQYSQLGNFVRLRDGGPCPLTNDEDRDQAPF
ncbi:MAG: hypothetical protein AAF715_13195 [Myxococcota bacterium]